MQEQDAYHEDDLYVWDDARTGRKSCRWRSSEQNKMFRGTTSTMRRSGSRKNTTTYSKP